MPARPGCAPSLMSVESDRVTISAGNRMASGDQSQDVPQIDPLVYARQGRRWVGKVPSTAFERLAGLAALEDVAVELTFEIDDHDRVRMRGGGKAEARIVCQRCLEEVDVAVESSLDVRVMASERSAQEVGKQYDTIVIDARTLSVAELVEDDLILSLPELGCGAEEHCPHRLPTAFPDEASADEGDGEAAREDNPFAVLESLKSKLPTE